MSLLTIQQKLKAPKGQFNSFGKYKYRNCEDILEAVKPLLAETKTTLTLTDEMVEVGNRVYVKATATLCSDKEVIATVSAFAREEESKAGMAASQLTGATSSYARKYALNGLFCIDDTKDADSDEPTKTDKPTADKPKTAKTSNTVTEPSVTVEKAIALINAATNLGELKKAFTGLPKEIQANAEVIAAKDTAKYDFTNNQ